MNMSKMMNSSRMSNTSYMKSGLKGKTDQN